MMQRTWFMRMGGAALVLPSLAVLALVAGCSEKTSKMLIPNQPPTVRLTQAPVSPAPGDSVYYAYRLNWTGYDPDGRVDYYLYAIDPPSVDRVDSTWVRTERNEEFLFFPATNPDRISTSLSTASDPHIFAIRAVDNLGAMSAVVSRGFYSYTIAPIVTIVDPPAGGLAIVSPSVRIVWRGEDPDGVFTQKPLKYKYRLFASGARPADFPYPVDEPDFLVFATLNPDSLRKGYAPESRVDGLSFPGWDSTNAESTEAQYANLVPESNYLFVVTGFDEAGAYDPVFSARNMLQLFVTFANNASPIITMFNDFFNYTYLVGGYLSEERFAFDLEVPCGQEITFNWFATSRGGASIRRYRWVMDLVNLDDETTRSNELTDWYHWSAWSLNNTSATVGPFHVNDETHRFYIEAEDNNNLVSLGSILFRVVCATLDRQLLIVNDTRFVADDRVGGGVRPPGGPWPTAAELDTFMLARGGFPWKSYPGYDTDNPTLSPPGLFSRYRFDSLGTRGLRDAIVPISTLGKYRHVVWYTDQLGAGYTANSFDRVKPITALREMSKPNRAVTLATYMRQGGKTWLSGGGIIRATLDPWHRVNPTNMWTNRDLELVPGRMLYDFAHFRTAVTTGSGKEV
ncbi:MAG TPA: hypothetical protein VEY91_02445, partial [Candidatus Limnocylindria bacterium]|nr:hypothetical protein [Candidatus Limnocylindria bacterium]